MELRAKVGPRREGAHEAAGEILHAEHSLDGGRGGGREFLCGGRGNDQR